MIVYGLKNCDTTQKAIKWLNKNKIEFQFHDYKLSGIDKSKLETWSSEIGWENLLNKKSTTWREIDSASQLKIVNEKSAIALMLKKPTCIKRPLIEKNNKVLALGFKEDEYEAKIN